MSNSLTESKIWSRIKPWLLGYKVRIENVLTAGLSDVLWCPNGRSVFLELKVRDGNYITVRNSQIVFGIDARASVPPNQHLFVVGTSQDEPLYLYKFNSIERCPAVLHSQPGKQRFFIADTHEDFEWTGAKDVRDYIEFLEEGKRNGTTI